LIPAGDPLIPMSTQHIALLGASEEAGTAPVHAPWPACCPTKTACCVLPNKDSDMNCPSTGMDGASCLEATARPRSPGHDARGLGLDRGDEVYLYEQHRAALLQVIADAWTCKWFVW
jgi:hypothetical protein